jgi:cell wall assembly regulator SMI1
MIEAPWFHLEHVLQAFHPALLARLGDGASEADITACEAAMGIRLPGTFRTALARHGGDPTIVLGKDTLGMHGVFHHVDFLRPAAIAAQYVSWRDTTSRQTSMADPLGPVRPQWWNPKWIPITVVNGFAWHHCIDLDPAPGGTFGQIIEMGRRDARRIVVADSFTDLLTRLAEDVAAGIYRFDGEFLRLSDDAVDDRTPGGCRPVASMET